MWFAAIMAAGSIVQAMGAAKRASGEAAAGEYNARIAERNARISAEKAVEDERRFRINTTKEMGALRADYAASGVVMDGSPLDILEESVRFSELDAQTVRLQGDMVTRKFLEEARLSRMGAAASRSAGQYATASAVLSGASEISSKMPNKATPTRSSGGSMRGYGSSGQSYKNYYNLG